MKLESLVFYYDAILNKPRDELNRIIHCKISEGLDRETYFLLQDFEKTIGEMTNRQAHEFLMVIRPIGYLEGITQDCTLNGLWYLTDGRVLLSQDHNSSELVMGWEYRSLLLNYIELIKHRTLPYKVYSALVEIQKSTKNDIKSEEVIKIFSSPITRLEQDPIQEFNGIRIDNETFNVYFK